MHELMSPVPATEAYRSAAEAALATVRKHAAIATVSNESFRMVKT
jgi:hypothetical protein